MYNLIALRTVYTGESQLDHIRCHQYIQKRSSDVAASSLIPQPTHPTA